MSKPITVEHVHRQPPAQESAPGALGFPIPQRDVRRACEAALLLKPSQTGPADPVLGCRRDGLIWREECDADFMIAKSPCIPDWLQTLVPNTV